MRCAFVLSLLLAYVLIAGDANAAGPFATPVDVYAAAQAAVANNDYDGLCNCLTGDSLEIWAWMTVIASQSARQQLENRPDDSIPLTPKAIATVLEAHGLSQQKINRAVVLSLAKEQDERGKVFSEALKDVHHKPRFIVDMYLELRKMKTDLSKFDTMRIFDWIKPDFVELSVDGKNATAQVPQAEGAKQKVRTVQFRKEGDSWLIYFPMDFQK